MVCVCLCMCEFVCVQTPTVWPDILVGNLFWQIGGFESYLPIYLLKLQYDVIIMYTLLRDIINM